VDQKLADARAVLKRWQADDEPRQVAAAKHMEALMAWDSRVAVWLADTMYRELTSRRSGPLMAELNARWGLAEKAAADRRAAEAAKRREQEAQAATGGAAARAARDQPVA
jgi:hypothetical protein